MASRNFPREAWEPTLSRALEACLATRPDSPLHFIAMACLENEFVPPDGLLALPIGTDTVSYFDSFKHALQAGLLEGLRCATQVDAEDGLSCSYEDVPKVIGYSLLRSAFKGFSNAKLEQLRSAATELGRLELEAVKWASNDLDRRHRELQELQRAAGVHLHEHPEILDGLPRPTVGSWVVLESYGYVGVVIQDDGSEKPFQVASVGPERRTLWFTEQQVGTPETDATNASMRVLHLVCASHIKNVQKQVRRACARR
jgi:hypothetical protein